MIMTKIKNWNKYRQTVRELSRMSDKELFDIGIHRADIQKIARDIL